MRELVKRQVTRFIMRYTCQVCERQTETVIGVDYKSDEEALQHVSSHFVNGWWVADDQVVCVFCLSKAHDAFGPLKIKGMTARVRRAAQYAFKHEKEFAEVWLQKLNEMVGDLDGDEHLTPREAEFLADSLKSIERLRKKLGV